jgi:hypothetical protein
VVWEEADALLDWGRALAADGKRNLATEKFAEAVALYRRSGAGQFWLERARSAAASLEYPVSGHSQTVFNQEQTAAHLATQHKFQGVFRREGDYWTICLGEEMSRLRDSKGLAYLEYLRKRPGVEVSARDMALIGGAAERTVRYETRIWDGAAEVAVGLGDAGAVLDREAVAQYKRRLAELDEQITEAERNNDAGHRERLHREREFLLQQLSAALGLSGRQRRVASHSERARWLVTKGIKGVMRKIAQTNPDLTHHFRLSVRTGATCVYLPARPVIWRF